MAVSWIKQSLKKLNEEAREQQTAKAEIAELQDALIEIAEMVSQIADNMAGGGNDGQDICAEDPQGRDET